MSTRHRSRLITTTFFFHVLFLTMSVCFGAVTNTWTGSTDTDWFTATNWSEGVVPTNGHHVIIDSISSTTNVLLTNSTANLASFVITSNTLTFTNWTTQLNGSNVTVAAAGNITVANAFTNNGMSNRVYIVGTNLLVESGGAINVDALGYKGGFETATSSKGHGAGGATCVSGYGGGGGYGGSGGRSQLVANPGPTNGVPSQPLAPGSGGGGGTTFGVGGHGGGAILVDASLVTVNGTVTANGGNGGSGSAGGGGSGGGILINCSVIAGAATGIVRANGGNASGGLGGPGGGGRIAIRYDPSAQALQGAPGISFSVSPSANGYAGNPQAGSVYFSDAQLLSIQAVSNAYVYGITNLVVPSLMFTNAWWTLAEADASVVVTSNLVVGASGYLGIHLENSRLDCGGDLIVTNGGSLVVYAGATNGAVNYGALVSVTNDMLIYSNSWVVPYSEPNNGGSVLFRVKNLTLAGGTNCGIDATGAGFAALQGYGKGATDGSSYGGGGGYGGKGGSGGNTFPAGGSTYGSTNAPVGPGSGAGGSVSPTTGAGGGLVRIEATDSAMINGVIRANGLAGTSSGNGGGSGGGIFIRCTAFSGDSNSRLEAKGGNGQTYGGGGGGGRIAVWYAVPESRRAGILDGTDMRRVSIITNASEYSDFSGTVSVTNGTGYTNLPPVGAECGTIVFLTVTPPSGTMFMCQ